MTMTPDEFLADPGRANKNEPPREENTGRYMLPDPGDDGPAKARTRATTVAKTLDDTYLLDLWHQRMAALGLAARPDLVARVAAVAEPDSADGKREINEIVEQAKFVAGAGAGANFGTALHAFTEQRTHGAPIEAVPEEMRPDVLAYEEKLAEYGIVELPRFTERTVLNEDLNTAGRFDRIWQMPDGTLVIGDLKTQRSVDFGAMAIAVQLAIYAHAKAMMDFETGNYEPMPPVSKDYAVVAHLPVGEARCTLYKVDLRIGWAAAAVAYQARELRAMKSVMLELRPGFSGSSVPAPATANTIPVTTGRDGLPIEHLPPAYPPKADGTQPTPAEARELAADNGHPPGGDPREQPVAILNRSSSPATLTIPDTVADAQPLPGGGTLITPIDLREQALTPSPDAPPVSAPDHNPFDAEALLKAYKTKPALQAAARLLDPGIKVERTRSNLAKDMVSHARWPEMRGQLLGTVNAAKVVGAAQAQHGPQELADQHAAEQSTQAPQPGDTHTYPDDPFGEQPPARDFMAEMQQVNTREQAKEIWEAATAAGLQSNELMSVGAKRLQEMNTLR